VPVLSSVDGPCAASGKLSVLSVVKRVIRPLMRGVT
jgi:hypothetical protein